MSDYADVDWVEDEKIAQVKLNQTEANVAAARAATDVRLVAQIQSDWDFTIDGAAMVVTFGGVQLLTTPAWVGLAAAVDVDVSAAPLGLINVVIGQQLVKFWRTPDMVKATVWLETFVINDNLPHWQIRDYAATVIAHRLARGGY